MEKKQIIEWENILKPESEVTFNFNWQVSFDKHISEEQAKAILARMIEDTTIQMEIDPHFKNQAKINKFIIE